MEDFFSFNGMPLKLLISLIILFCICSILPGCKKDTSINKTNSITHAARTSAELTVSIDPDVTRFHKRTTGWIAADGGITIKLSNNKVLWLYGDTYFNVYRASDGTTPCLFGARSTAMYQPYNDWDPAHTTSIGPPPGDNSLFRSNQTKGYYNWPSGGVQIGDTVYIYADTFKQVTGGLGFDYGGPAVLAKMVNNKPYIVKYHELQDFNKITFSVGMEKEADGYVYVFGSRQTFIAADIFLARFPQSNPNAKWKFWDGTGWNDDVLKAKAIVNAPSTSNSMVRIKGRYVLFTSEFNLGCDGGKKIYVTPTAGKLGPFLPRKVIYTIPDQVQGHSPFFYGPTPHPEYINDKNELLLTYSINGYEPCVPNCVNGRFNPDYYRPRGIRIPLKLIDPSF